MCYPPYHFWGRMLASALKFNTFSLPGHTLQYATLLVNFQLYKLHGFNLNNLIRCMIKICKDPD